MSELATRQGAGGVAAYSGPEDIRAAGFDARRARAAAELAKRAGVDEVEHAIGARRAERQLGVMLLAGRAAGDVAGHGWRSDVDRADITTLADLDVPRDLAADAVAFASIPDDVWAVMVNVGELRDATHAAITRAARAYLDDLDAAERARREDAERLSTLRADAPDLAELVERDALPLVEAVAAHAERTREARKLAADELAARRDLYSGMARALLTTGTYGGYADLAALMGEYDPGELDPPQLARAFGIENLSAARRLIDALIEGAQP